MNNEFTIEKTKVSDAEGIYDVFHLVWLDTYPRVQEDEKYNITVEDIEERYVDRKGMVKSRVKILNISRLMLKKNRGL
ncbi:MAG: hypothetical protein WCJ19_01710 [bacterium]